MKNLTALFICLVLLIGNHAYSQSCDGNRFLNETFSPNINSRFNITFGSNTAVSGGSQETLKLHFYEPQNDTMSKRPLIIFVHGGSFISGNKTDVSALCTKFAKMGYATATIDYRVGFFGIPNEVTTTLAVMRCMHDINAAVRFFRQDAATVDTFHIDTDRIIIGGESAGAIGAIHSAYLNEEAEIPAYLVNDTAGLGGIDGNSGNPGYSASVLGVINYAGAIGDTSWIIPGDVPMVSFHYIGDPTVPYDTRLVNVSGFPTGLTASGSGSIKTRTDHIGVIHELTSFTGTKHTDFLHDSDLDSVIYKTKTFIYDNMTCKQTSTSISEVNSFQNDLTVYPNPSTGNFIARTNGLNKEISLKVFNAQGKQVYYKTGLSGTQIPVDLKQLSKGLYFISLQSKTGENLGLQKIVVE